MHDYNTILGVIELRLSKVSYDAVQKRYRIGRSGIALIIIRDCWISWDLNPGFIAVIPNVSCNRRSRSSGECSIRKSSASLMKHI